MFESSFLVYLFTLVLLQFPPVISYDRYCHKLWLLRSYLCYVIWYLIKISCLKPVYKIQIVFLCHWSIVYTGVCACARVCMCVCVCVCVCVCMTLHSNFLNWYWNHCSCYCKQYLVSVLGSLNIIKFNWSWYYVHVWVLAIIILLPPTSWGVTWCTEGWL